MDMSDIFFKAVGVTVVVAVIGAVARHIYLQNVAADNDKILEDIFGEPTRTGTFTLEEATTWLKSHLRDGCHGVIFRADCLELKKYAPDLNLGDELKNYLVMTIVDKSANTMADHVLVKFDALDANLTKALGDEGMLVIEG